MRPLLYLWAKSFVNGLKRALLSPRRLLGLLFFAAYYFLFFVRGFGPRPAPTVAEDLPPLPFPPLELVEGVVFVGFCAFSLFLALGILGYRSNYKPADVDVLFPLPLNPKHVLLFKMARDYAVTLMMPLLLALITWRSTSTGVERLFTNLPSPEYAGLALRAITVSWMLMSLAWVSMSYAASLWTDRTDLDGERNRRWIVGIVGSAIAFAVAFATFSISRTEYTAEDWLALSQSPVLRVLFFTATAATELVMAPLRGSWTAGILGFGGLVAIIVFSLRAAMAQTPWMYDQAAARGTSAATLRQLRQSNDTIGLAAELARQGKVRARKLGWLNNLHANGAAALIWKEAFVQLRTLVGIMAILVATALFMTLVPAYYVRQGRAGEAVGFLFLAMLCFALFLAAVGIAQSGATETLRRVDLLKPLPFSSATIVFAEVASKAVPAIATGWLCCIGFLLIHPDKWPFALAGAIVAPFFSLGISATVCGVTILFPDVEDPTQRGFRGLMMLLALAVLNFPPVALGAGLLALKLPPPVAATGFAMLMLALSVGISFASGALYASYNPSE